MSDSNAEQQYIKRPFKSSVTNFGSTLKNHPDDHGKLFAMTTYQSAFSRNENNDMLSQTMKERELREKGSGGKLQSEKKNEGTKLTSVLVGEQYRDFEDPQHNTHCQRTWVYGGDSTLTHTDANLRKTLDALGGNATPEEILAVYRLAKNPKARIGDAATSLPLESNLIILMTRR